MNNNLNTVIKSFNVLKEMFEARGEQHISDALQAYGTDHIKQLYTGNQIFHIDIETKVRLLYSAMPKFKSQDLKKYIEEFDLIVLIVREKLSSANMKTALELGDSIHAQIQVFSLPELQFNISKHILVPKHTLIKSSNEERIASIIQSLNIKSKVQLPIILKTDAMARFLNARPGDIVEILRYSPTSGEHLFYRLCM